MEIFLLVLVALGVGLAFVLAKVRKQQEEIENFNREFHAGRARESVKHTEEFESSLADAWPVRFRDNGTVSKTYLMMSADQRMLRKTFVRVLEPVEVKYDRILSVDSIVSIEVQQSSETVMKFETSSITTKRGGLTRAAVGGLTFGGAGAIVGAVTAKSSTSGGMIGTSKTVRDQYIWS